MSDTTTTKGIHGLGRRKTAIAQVLLTTEDKARTVNEKPFEEYFTTAIMRSIALRTLTTSSQDDVYGFRLKVQGGGKLAQAQAASLAMARALIGVDEGYKKQLRKAGLLTRDPRAKERKKPGLRGARRAPQFSKR
ncbi:MAG: 30S ribosomal protein S9 [Candidatus Andersenbacteria bacterium]